MCSNLVVKEEEVAVDEIEDIDVDAFFNNDPQDTKDKKGKNVCVCVKFIPVMEWLQQIEILWFCPKSKFQVSVSELSYHTEVNENQRLPDK